MKKQLRDTHPEIERIMIEGYRKMTPLQKLKKVNELNKSIQQIALARIRKQYRNISEREQQLHLASLWLDRDVMIKAFGWDPKKRGY